MMLNDRQIRVLCTKMDVVDPFDPALVGPSSLDIRLGSRIAYYAGTGIIDPDNQSTYNLIKKDAESQIILKSNQFILMDTVETFRIPSNIAAKVDGRSSIGRLGIMVHVTAGFIDPGFHGKITLEIKNVNERSVILRPGMIIAQMSFHEIEPCERDYSQKGGRYHGDGDVAGSKYYIT